MFIGSFFSVFRILNNGKFLLRDDEVRAQGFVIRDGSSNMMLPLCIFSPLKFHFLPEDCSNDGSENGKEEIKASPWLLRLDGEECVPNPMEAAASIQSPY